MHKALRRRQSKAVRPNTEWMNGNRIMGVSSHHVPHREKPTEEEIRRGVRLISRLLPDYNDEPL
jgi:hypothetical protein